MARELECILVLLSMYVYVYICIYRYSQVYGLQHMNLLTLCSGARGWRYDLCQFP